LFEPEIISELSLWIELCVDNCFWNQSAIPIFTLNQISHESDSRKLCI